MTPEKKKDDVSPKRIKSKSPKKQPSSAIGHINTKLKGGNRERLLELLEKVGGNMKYDRMRFEGRKLNEREDKVSNQTYRSYHDSDIDEHHL